MGPSTDAALNVKQLKPLKGEDVESLAIRCYELHIEVLASWAGSDLDPGWMMIPEKAKQGWRKVAREKLNAAGRGTARNPSSTQSRRGGKLSPKIGR